MRVRAWRHMGDAVEREVCIELEEMRDRDPMCMHRTRAWKFLGK